MVSSTEFEDKTVLLTCTARSIGRACATSFAERGARVGGDVRDQPETVAALGGFPASDAGPSVTGEIVLVDGGRATVE